MPRTLSRLLAVAVAAATAAAVPPIPSAAESASRTVGDFAVSYDPDHAVIGASITDYLGSDTEPVIPATVEIDSVEYAITGIGRTAFADRALTAIVIPDSVVTIGDSAFALNRLTSATIGDSVTSIGHSAFAHNALSTIVIPDSVDEIGESAFEHNRLTSVTFGDSVTSIGPAAFFDNGLTSVTIPGSVTVLGGVAFSRNPLRSVVLEGPEPTTDRGSVFGSGGDAPIVTISARYARPGFRAPTWTFGAETYPVRVVDEDGTVIAPTPTPVPWSVGIVDGYVLRYESANVAAGASIIDYFGSDTDLVIPAAVDFDSVEYAVTDIGDYALSDLTLSSVDIPDSVITIGRRAFDDSSLTSATIGDSVTHIGEEAFRGNALDSVSLGRSVAVIDRSAFENNSLDSIDIPGSVVTIGHRAFYHNALTSVTIPNSVTEIYGLAFANNHLTSVTLPDSITEIRYSEFAHNRLTSVTIPNSVTAIGDSAFEDNQLASVTIPGNVSEIGDSAFDGNPLETVIMEGPAPRDTGRLVFGFGGRAPVVTYYSECAHTGYGESTWVVGGTQYPLKVVDGACLNPQGFGTPGSGGNPWLYVAVLVVVGAGGYGLFRWRRRAVSTRPRAAR